MGRSYRNEKSDFDQDDRKSSRKRGHARNIPGIGMRVLNPVEVIDDVELDEDISIYLNNTRLYNNIK